MTWKFGFALAMALAAQSAQPAAAQVSEAVAAIVNDDVISTYDVRQRALFLLASSGIQPTAESQQQAAQQAMRDLVDERLQMQEAAHYEITVTDEQVNDQINAVAQQNRTDLDGLSRQLAAAGINISTLRNQIRADTAWRRLVGGRYGSRVRISDIQIRETQERIAQAATRTQYQASEIFLAAVTDEEMTQAEQFAQRLLQEMQRGAPFPLVARQFSSAPSAAAGGDLGWVAAGEIRPELENVMSHLQPGQVSTPVRSEGGVYILALRERREGVAAASISRVGLRQITAPAASRAALERARARLTTCTGLEQGLSSVSGASVTDLGEVAEADLSDAVRAQITGVQAGAMSAITETGDQVSVLMVCSRQTAAEGIPAREEIENRLYEQELAMLANRYLRNLRREATIITR